MLKLKKIVSQLQRALESMLGKLFILGMRRRQKGREGWRVHTALRTAGSVAPAPRMLLS